MDASSSLALPQPPLTGAASHLPPSPHVRLARHRQTPSPLRRAPPPPYPPPHRLRLFPNRGSSLLPLSPSPSSSIPLKRVSTDSLQYESGYLGGISTRLCRRMKMLMESAMGSHAVSYLRAYYPLGFMMSPSSHRCSWRWRSVEQLGATVVLTGDSYDEAQTYAKQRADQETRAFVPPFDHRDVITGQGTIGLEIIRQLKGPLHAIFVPVGGGGLIAGIASFVKRIRPEVKVIGVEPFDANAMALSLYHGKRVMLEKVGGFADGVAVKVVGEENFRICRELVDGVILVNQDAICASIKDMFDEKRSILEPAGALSLAGAEAYCKYYGLKGENIVAITSGANMNFDRLSLVSKLATSTGANEKHTAQDSTSAQRSSAELCDRDVYFQTILRKAMASKLG
ncbi:uncharacterized protein A4U43_C03F16380 [Asparagus officinalis]|uniref:threonine ammonia-lyase n=1 Tax=Asparagus officinalis TaxID=4686 RepID=A0A5P1FB37_ASPOF|nr:uncharacterized protein A4U43_C03F16380 [Asparagus officinalis]